MDDRSKYLRSLIFKMVYQERRGHIGPALSLVEIMRVLFDDFLNYHPQDPHWSERDRFILSKGHGCLALYALLADKGFFAMDQLETACKFDSFLGGHPERGKVPGVEASTGALGHGLPIGVGMAVAAKIKKLNHRVVVVCGDGEINEGSVWEAAVSASKHCLGNLMVIIDYNKMQSYGDTEKVLSFEPLVDKWLSFGFMVNEVDGHSIPELQNTFEKVNVLNDRPKVIICHTVKGKGLSLAENNPSWHHKRLSEKELEIMKSEWSI
jgi:transketolase